MILYRYVSMRSFLLIAAIIVLIPEEVTIVLAGSIDYQLNLTDSSI